MLRRTAYNGKGMAFGQLPIVSTEQGISKFFLLNQQKRALVGNISLREISSRLRGHSVAQPLSQKRHDFSGNYPRLVLCETPTCLPDAIQLLTACTVENGRLQDGDICRACRGRSPYINPYGHGATYPRAFSLPVPSSPQHPLH
jgi:hypothetical protein